MPTRAGANSPSIKLAAKIGACRKFESPIPNKGSYLFKNSPRNQSSSLNPFASANTSRYGVKRKKPPLDNPDTCTAPTPQYRRNTQNRIIPTINPKLRLPRCENVENNL